MKALLDAPMIEPGLEWIWEAFWALSPSRQGTLAPKHVPLSEFIAWCEWRRLPLSVQDDLLHYMRAMEVVYFELLREQKKDKDDGPKAKG